MATDSRNSGSVPPAYNPYYTQYPPAQSDKHGVEDKSGTDSIAVIAPETMGVPENQSYGIPPDYQDLEEFNCFSDASIRRGLYYTSLTLHFKLLYFIVLKTFIHSCPEVYTVHSVTFIFTYTFSRCFYTKRITVTI